MNRKYTIEQLSLIEQKLKSKTTESKETIAENYEDLQIVTMALEIIKYRHKTWVRPKKN